MTHSNLLAIDDLNFEAEVLGADLPFLLVFSGAWCAPCQKLTPTLERLASAHPDRVRVGKIDSEESPLTAARFDVRAVPTLLLFDHGEVVARRVGSTDEAGLLKLLPNDPRTDAPAPVSMARRWFGNATPPRWR